MSGDSSAINKSNNKRFGEIYKYCCVVTVFFKKRILTNRTRQNKQTNKQTLSGDGLAINKTNNKKRFWRIYEYYCMVTVFLEKQRLPCRTRIDCLKLKTLVVCVGQGQWRCHVRTVLYIIRNKQLSYATRFQCLVDTSDQCTVYFCRASDVVMLSSG